MTVSIVGRRSGTVVALAVKGIRMQIRCDCGVERWMFSSALWRANLTCGDRERHPELVRPPAAPRDYRHAWHRKHATCAGWADVRAFVDAIGERPPGHGLSRTSGDVASCGECPECKAAGAARNVTWTAGGATSAAAVLHGGEYVSQAEVARREGVSREWVRRCVAMGVLLEGIGRRTVAPRENSS